MSKSIKSQLSPNSRMILFANPMKQQYTHFLVIHQKFKSSALSALPSNERAKYDDDAKSGKRAYFIEHVSAIDESKSEDLYRATNRKSCFMSISDKMRQALDKNPVLSSLKGEHTLYFLGITLPPNVLNLLLSRKQHFIMWNDHKYVQPGSDTLFATKLAVATKLQNIPPKNRFKKKKKLFRSIG
eukprot:233536_1